VRRRRGRIHLDLDPARRNADAALAPDKDTVFLCCPSPLQQMDASAPQHNAGLFFVSRLEMITRIFGSGNLADERRIAAELQMQVWQDVPFIPMGEYWQTTAYRKGLTGIIPGCFTVFYNVRRA
jgi:hypothetical protein